MKMDYRGYFPDGINVLVAAVEIYAEHSEINRSKPCPQKEPEGTWLETTVTVTFKEKLQIGLKVPFIPVDVGINVTVRDVVIADDSFTYAAYCCKCKKP